MTLGAQGDWSFVLPFRGTKLAGLTIVAVAIAVSTVLFQTLTCNRILTPAIMGFDQLYVALQTTLVLFVGSRDLAGLDPRLRFLVEAGLMVGLSLLLFRWLFSGERRSLHMLVLAGIVFGVLFRSLSSIMQRILDPNEFSVLQDLLFATFNTVDGNLVALSAVIVAPLAIVAWRLSPQLDVLALGRDTAIGLGVDHARLASLILVMVAILVSVSTALVGPATFFGLLVANLAYVLVGDRHRASLPAAALIAIVALVGGQAILERLFGLDAALGMIVEFVGGLVFIALLLRGMAR